MRRISKIKTLLNEILVDFEAMEYDLPCGKAEEGAPYYGISKQKERAWEIMRLVK